jgi:hypothetical protein
MTAERLNIHGTLSLLAMSAEGDLAYGTKNLIFQDEKSERTWMYLQRVLRTISQVRLVVFTTSNTNSIPPAGNAVNYHNRFQKRS